MRFRTAAASVVFVLCATTGATACSSSPDATEAERPATRSGPASVEGLAENIETGKRQAGPPALNEQSMAGPEKCAKATADTPPECALDLSFADLAEGERALEPPALP